MKAKKFLALFLALCLAVTVLASCGSSSSSSSSTGSSDDTAAASTDSSSEDASSVTSGTTADADELPAYKIGIICHTNSGGCWDRILDAATYLGDELNVKVSAAIGSSADQILSEAENFIASGVDGLIVMNDGGVTSRLVDLCSDAGVYIVFSDCGLTAVDDDDYSDYSTNPYYLGHVSHNEFDDAYACVEDMIANGATNFVVFGLPPGISDNFDQRAVGAEAAITDAGLTYVEARSYSMTEIANTLMSQYPDTDAIFSFVTTSDSFNVTDMASKYAGKIQISSYMADDVSYEFEIGFLTHVSTGSEARIELAFALEYSALRGYRIQNDDGTPAEIEFPHLWITNEDDYEIFYNAVTGGNHAYTIDEIKDLIGLYNPDVTPEDYQVIASAFSDTGSDGWLATR